MDITVMVADRFPNYSICGLPFYLSGEVPDWHTLAHRRADEIEGQGIRLLLEHRATGVDPEAKTVATIDKGGMTRMLKYDKLIVATGAVSARPPLEGLDLPGAFTPCAGWRTDLLSTDIWRPFNQNPLLFLERAT